MPCRVEREIGGEWDGRQMASAAHEAHPWRSLVQPLTPHCLTNAEAVKGSMDCVRFAHTLIMNPCSLAGALARYMASRFLECDIDRSGAS